MENSNYPSFEMDDEFNWISLERRVPSYRDVKNNKYKPSFLIKRFRALLLLWWSRQRPTPPAETVTAPIINPDAISSSSSRTMGIKKRGGGRRRTRKCLLFSWIHTRKNRWLCSWYGRSPVDLLFFFAKFASGLVMCANLVIQCVQLLCFCFRPFCLNYSEILLK